MTGERGSVALVTALLVLLVASTVAAVLTDLARTEALTARDRRIAATALAAADACLDDATAALPAGWDFDAVLAGPDGVVGTGDDGALVAPAGCDGRLQPGAAGPSRPLLRMTSTVAGGGRTLRAVIARPRRPLSPAALWSAAPASLGTVTGQLLLDGVDSRRPDAAPLPSLAGDRDPSLLDAWLAGQAATIGAGTPTTEWAPPPPLSALHDRLTAAGAGAALVVAAAPPTPTLQAIAGDAAVVAAGFGAGLLYVGGRLDIAADFSFSGVVVAVGGVRVAGGATLTVAGTLWVDGAPGLDVAGRAVVRHDETALEAVDALLPLPRRAAVVGVEDL